MDTFLLIELQFVAILIVASIVAIATRSIRIPYTVALVLAGLGVAVWGGLNVPMTPELVLALFVPPLLFEAALHVEFHKLRSDLLPVLTLAVPGVLLSALIVGGLLTLAGMSFPVALLFGALISATDPVAVVATFRAVGAPKRLTTLVEGESLFNDGTSVVLFNIFLALVITQHFSLAEGMFEFLKEVIGGVTVGVILGYFIAAIIARIDDYLIEITLTTVLAYGSYLLADSFHFSGVLAVVVAGLVNGNIGPRGMSPTTRIVLFNFWEYLAFLANSFVFILIGMNVAFDELQKFLGISLLAVVIVLVSRAINIYGLGTLIRYVKPDLDFNYLNVLFWGGLRGAISLAMVLSIPLTVSERPQLLAMTFAVVLFTLLIQATTIPSLLSRLGYTQASTIPFEYEQLQGRLLSTRSAHRHLEELYHEGALIPYAWQTVKSELEAQERELSDASALMLQKNPELTQKILRLARVETLRAQRAALGELASEGIIGSDALAILVAEVDEAIESPDAGEVALNLLDAESADT